MTLRDELEAVEKTEDIFALFGLAYDPRVMTVHRLHVVKRFGQEVAAIEQEEPEEKARWKRYTAALKRAHDYYLQGPPGGEHVFFGVQQGLVKIGCKNGRR